MIYVISKATFGSYNVRDIQCNANWDCCPYSDYALIPDSMVDGILATQGYCDITLNSAGTEVTGFTARTIPSVPDECCGTNTVLSVNGVKANTDGELTLTAAQVGARPNTWMPTYMEIGAAPAGYGLGEAAKGISDLDSAYNGFFNFSSVAANRPPLLGSSGAVMGYSGGSGSVQIATDYNGNSAFRKIGGEWEYINPPMEQGIEYRTTERALGRPVYKYLMYYGFLPNATEAGVNHGIDGMTQVIKIHLLPQGLNTQLDHNPQITKINVDAEKIYITTNSNLSSTRCYVLLEYCKD